MWKLLLEWISVLSDYIYMCVCVCIYIVGRRSITSNKKIFLANIVHHCDPKNLFADFIFQVNRYIQSNFNGSNICMTWKIVRDMGSSSHWGLIVVWTPWLCIDVGSTKYKLHINYNLRHNDDENTYPRNLAKLRKIYWHSEYLLRAPKSLIFGLKIN